MGFDWAQAIETDAIQINMQTSRTNESTATSQTPNPNRVFNPHPILVPLVGSHHHDCKKCEGGIYNQGVLGMLPGNQHADAMPEEGEHRGIGRNRTKVVKQRFALFELTSNRLLKAHQRQRRARNFNLSIQCCTSHSDRNRECHLQRA